MPSGAGAAAAVVENHLYALESKYNIIRANDAMGHASKLGMAAEMEHGVPVIPLPKRSPGLQALDYTFHDQIQTQMIGQTALWPADRTEAVAEFTVRLLATYNALSMACVNGGCRDMRRRLLAVHAAEGRHTKLD